jgi:hypothetical protein
VAQKYEEHLYFDHCLKVAQTADAAAPLAYEVGLCHDMLEDHLAGVGELQGILRQLNYKETEVSEIITAVTELTDVFTAADFPGLSRKERRKEEAFRLAGIGWLAQTVKYADLIDGARWVKENRPGKWEQYAGRKIRLLMRLNNGDLRLKDAAFAVFKKSH